MATSTQTTTTSRHVGSLSLRSPRPTVDRTFPELEARGFCVIKSAINPEKAAEYVDRMYKWGESFGLGFKADDSSTWHVDSLPPFSRGGLFNRHGCGQEQWAWDMRTEQSVIDIFSKIWGTDELLVSIDAINLSLPFPLEEAGERAQPWPHVDQSPNRRFKHCIQGLINLLPNGPDDGGLAVLEGSFNLYNEFFEAHQHQMPAGGWDWRDSFHYTEEHMQWFYDRGCKWTKPCADPGDVILWDSRCIHYGASPSGHSPRAAIYVCYKPAADIEPKVAALRKEVMDEHAMTSHDPLLFRVVGVKGYGPLPGKEYAGPKVKPVLTHRAQQLAGLVPY